MIVEWIVYETRAGSETDRRTGGSCEGWREEQSPFARLSGWKAGKCCERTQWKEVVRTAAHPKGDKGLGATQQRPPIGRLGGQDGGEVTKSPPPATGTRHGFAKDGRRRGEL